MENYTDIFAEIMNAWDFLELEAKELYPELDSEEIYQLCKDAMSRSLEN